MKRTMHFFVTTFAFYLITGFLLSAQAEPAKLNLGACSAEGSVFQADTEWLQVPQGQVLGQVTAVAVDDSDHVWVLHRPGSVTDANSALVLPPVLEFDDGGHFVQAFGGPDDQYQWPDREHSLAVSASGQIWVSGSAYRDLEPGRGDHMLLVFDSNGQFLRQIGQRGASEGNLDRENLNAPGDIFIDDEAREAYIADGYGNQRAIVFSTEDGRFLRMWGAYGTDEFPTSMQDLPESDPQADSFHNVHGVEIANDGKVYISDRMNQRIQVFSADGTFLDQTLVNPGYPSPLTASGITFSTDDAQKYMFVVDWGNHTIEVFDRHSLEHIARIGNAGTQPGEFLGPHLIDTDSRGNLYIAEVQGARLQRLAPCNTDNGAVIW